MTLTWQISFIDDLIRENPDAEIKDYLALLTDIEQIENQTEDMGSRKGIPNLTPEQVKRIINMAEELVPPTKIASIMGVQPNAVYKVIMKKAGSIMVLKHPEVLQPQEPELKAESSTSFIRPLAQYSNSGFLSVTEKYSI